MRHNKKSPGAMAPGLRGVVRVARSVPAASATARMEGEADEPERQGDDRHPPEDVNNGARSEENEDQEQSEDDRSQGQPSVRGTAAAAQGSAMQSA
jgi:hypothetical protein